MAIQRLPVTSVPDQVHEILRDRILAGQLEPGARLHQAGISQELGVSRTPVREAIARLAAEDLVELLANRGARVAMPADPASTYEARLGVEPVAARLAAERGDGATLRRALKAGKAGYSASRAFHLGLVQASGNALLVSFAEKLWPRRPGAGRMTPEELAADAREHERILEAIEAGDEARAERLTREHIERVHAVLTR